MLFRFKLEFIALAVGMLLWGPALGVPECRAGQMPFAPGERLTYELRWENVPAGRAQLEVQPLKSINAAPAYHFVMTAESNRFIDIFYKVRDRIDAFADVDMNRSLRYRKKQKEGRHEKDEVIEFDWDHDRAHYSNYGEKRDPIELLAGSFDPLSALYYTRMVDFGATSQAERPITDGTMNVIGRVRVAGRETITLKNGLSYDTYILEPEMNHVGGVFKESDDATIRIWVTADERRIPVLVKSKVVIGHFIGELVSAEGIINPGVPFGRPPDRASAHAMGPEEDLY